MNKNLLLPLLAALPLAGFTQALQEDFNDISALTAAGWTLTNQSDPIGTTTWFQGNPDVFTAYNGPDSSYISANYNNTSGSGTISNWMITPAVNVQDGDVVKFWTRTFSPSEYNDRLEVRSSPGAMTAPVGATDVGSFTNLLLTINDALDLTYPESWTLYTITISGVGSTPVAQRFAFRYNVPVAGPMGDNSDIIGIDAVYIGDPGGTPPVEVCTPVLNCSDGDLITNVTFGSINNTTDCSANGYGDYTSMSTMVEPGNSYPISVTVGGGYSAESVSVWLDLDSSNTFEMTEFTYIGTDSAAAVTGSIAIPAGQAVGTYRMRVRVAAVGSTLATGGLACDEAQGYGETEDYNVVVNIGSGIAANNSNGFSFFPNPVQDVLHFNSASRVKTLAAFNIVGREVAVDAQASEGRINVSSLSAGVYVFRLTFVDGTVETFRVTKQ